MGAVREGNQAERGFTLIELMIVVAIVAILAAVIVPTFMEGAGRTKSKSEVSPMFSELGHKEDQYKAEFGSYLAAAACPSAASESGTDVTSVCFTSGSPWSLLRIVPSEKSLKCSYVVTVGTSATAAAGVAAIPTWVTTCKNCGTIATPSTSWYYIIATCPQSRTYFTASWDAKIRSSDGK